MSACRVPRAVYIYSTLCVVVSSKTLLIDRVPLAMNYTIFVHQWHKDNTFY